LLTDITIERLPWIIWMGPTRSQKVFKMEEWDRKEPERWQVRRTKIQLDGFEDERMGPPAKED
jgi:hypothetical protein